MTTTTINDRAKSAKVQTVALVGNPNSGKSTLFNRLTGLRHQVGNYPGVTVERQQGVMKGLPGTTVLDLPGCYSLRSCSLDERICRDVLLGWVEGLPRPDVLVVVADATNLERHFFLATEILELGIPTILVCNMLDELERRGDRIDFDRLSAELGIAVVGTVATTGRGLDRLRELIGESVEVQNGHLWGQHASPIPPELERSRQFVREFALADEAGTDSVAMLLLSRSVLERNDPAYIRLPKRAEEALRTIQQSVDGDAASSLIGRRIQDRYKRIGEIVQVGVIRSADRRPTVTDRIDRIATHRLWGMVMFSSLMAVMFLAIFSWAEPVMGLIEQLIGGIGQWVSGVLGAGMLSDLLVDGVIAGVGNVVVFFPQICILFLFIGLLEDSGYMARVAFVMDRVMAGVGLHGRSFIPLLSSFACAVPAVMATRTIADRRDRLATMMILPLMSCSARLPIYLLMISALFGSSVWIKSGIMFAMYALGLVTALMVAWVLKRTLLKGPTPTFLMELPPYRRPKIGAALRHMWDRSRLFLTDAGTIILAMSIVLWALAYFPRAADWADVPGGGQLRQSYLGRMGKVMEPVIEPLGFDWKIGVGLGASFAAREVFVATMGVVYGIDEEVDETSMTLRERIAADTWPDGRRVYTPLVGISLMVFYVLACQCMSTLAVVKRETGGWRWPVFMFTYMTALAYVASLIVFQCGTLLGLA